MEEMYPCYIESIYLFKRLHDRGMAEGLMKSYGNTEIDADMYYELSYESIGSVFTDSNNFYNQEEEIETWVFMDPLLDEFCVLCQSYELEHTVSPDENPYRDKFENIIRSGLSFGSYDYDFDWKLLPTDRGRNRILLFMGPEFAFASEVPCGLMDIYDGLEYCVKHLRTEILGKNENILALPPPAEDRKEAA